MSDEFVPACSPADAASLLLELLEMLQDAAAHAQAGASLPLESLYDVSVRAPRAVARAVEALTPVPDLPPEPDEGTHPPVPDLSHLPPTLRTLMESLTPGAAQPASAHPTLDRLGRVTRLLSPDEQQELASLAAELLRARVERIREQER